MLMIFKVLVSGHALWDLFLKKNIQCGEEEST